MCTFRLCDATDNNCKLEYMGGVPVGIQVYPICSFQTPNEHMGYFWMPMDTWMSMDTSPIYTRDIVLIRVLNFFEIHHHCKFFWLFIFNILFEYIHFYILQILVIYIKYYLTLNYHCNGDD